MSNGDKSVIIKDIELIPYLRMVWDNSRKENGELLYKGKPEGISEEIIFENNDALAHLLATDQVFTNNHWWRSAKENKDTPEYSWPEEACRCFSINANCNDVFAWGCADAENVEHQELESLYDHFHKDPTWGGGNLVHKEKRNFPTKAG